MGLFSLGNLAKLGGFVAAPFTGGASIPIGLGIGGALDAGKQQGRANEASQQALDFARQDVESRQPFRDQLFASLQGGQPQRQDLSNLFGSENPFAQNLGPLNPQAQQMTAPVVPPQAPQQGPQQGPGGFIGRLQGIARGLPGRGQDILDESPSRFLGRS